MMERLGLLVAVALTFGAPVGARAPETGVSRPEREKGIKAEPHQPDPPVPPEPPPGSGITPRQTETTLPERDLTLPERGTRPGTEDQAGGSGCEASGGFSTVGIAPVQKLRPPGKGELTGGPMRIGRCEASRVVVRYNLTAMMGDPWGGAQLAWEGDPGCKLPYDTTLWLRIQSGTAYGWIRFNLDEPLPRANGKSGGTNTPPFWGKLVCGFKGSGLGECVDGKTAKRIYGSGRITEFVLGWPCK